MSRNEKQEQIQKLVDKIIEAADAYYDGLSPPVPIMSDAQYDALVDELERIDPENTALKIVGGTTSQTKLKKTKLTIPMGSLKKVNAQTEFEIWVKKTGAPRFVVQEKYDGISVEVTYEDGRLKQAVTRGDGITGEDITHNVRFMRNVPVQLTTRFSGVLRGEIILQKSDFEKYFAGDAYANPRNTVSGMSRKKKTDARVAFFRVIYYDAICDSHDFEQEITKLKFMLSVLKLEITPFHRVSTINAVGWYKYYVGHRDNLDYEIDGLVIKVDDLATQRQLGSVSNRPKGQIAWKFASQMATTKLTGIVWQVGLSGRITPVAQLDPVEVGGVTIAKASLHTVSNIQKLKLQHTGSEVLVSRRNDVIPYVEEVTRNNTAGGKLRVPEQCPVCQAKLHFGGEFLICSSSECLAKKRGGIEKWIKVCGMKNLGTIFLEDVMNSEFVAQVSDPADLYKLTLQDLVTLPGYKERKSQTILNSIQAHKTLPLYIFLAGLNIPNAGRSMFKLVISAGYKTLETIQNAGTDKLGCIDGIGEVIAAQMCRGLLNKASLIEKLLFVGVEIETGDVKEGILSGESFCFTGTLPSGMSRTVAHKLVGYHGGEIKKSVTRGLTYLVQANPESNTTKSQKAHKYGTKVIGEDRFLSLINFEPSVLDSL